MIIALLIVLLTIPANVYFIYHAYSSYTKNKQDLEIKVDSDRVRNSYEQEVKSFNDSQWQKYKTEWEQTKNTIKPMLDCGIQIKRFIDESGLAEFYRKLETEVEPKMSAQLNSDERIAFMTKQQNSRQKKDLYVGLEQLTNELGLWEYNRTDPQFDGGIFIYGSDATPQTLDKNKVHAVNSLNFFTRRNDRFKFKNENFTCHINQVSLDEKKLKESCVAVKTMIWETETPKRQEFDEGDNGDFDYERSLKGHLEAKEYISTDCRVNQ